jgi:acyl-coenzyme A thioesterase PaaI-like protein
MTPAGTGMGSPGEDGREGEAARVSLADAARQLIVAVTTAGTSVPELVVAREFVEAAVAALGPIPTVAAHRAATEAGHRRTANPFDSPLNPLAPPLRPLPSAPGEYLAEVILSPAYEGPPGRVHGGVVTGILDHVCGFALRALGIVAMSVSLQLDLLGPTPYGEPLRVTARVDHREGRKIWVEAALFRAGGDVLATCRTLMIELREPPAWASTALG